jgi:uncharacterized protein (DUF952 family)
MSEVVPTLVYKLTTLDDWTQAVVAGTYAGSPDDHRDGFIHLSSRHQVDATAQKYFSHIEGLCIVAFETADLGDNLRFEVSRGGDLFPHYYGQLPSTHALWIKPVPLDADGAPVLPDDI